jgi:hypothetical protein
MQTQTGEIHVPRCTRAIEIGENTRNFLPIGGVYLRCIGALVETLKSAVPEAADHPAR